MLQKRTEGNYTHVRALEKMDRFPKKGVSKSGRMIIRILTQRHTNTLKPAGSLIHSVLYKEA